MAFTTTLSEGERILARTGNAQMRLYTAGGGAAGVLLGLVLIGVTETIGILLLVSGIVALVVAAKMTSTQCILTTNRLVVKEKGAVTSYSLDQVSSASVRGRNVIVDLGGHRSKPVNLMGVQDADGLAAHILNHRNATRSPGATTA